MAVPICLPALYYAKLGSKFRRCFHWYFVVAAAFLFPFSFGLMLILNAAFAPKGVQIDILWILQYFIALFVFIQVIYNSLLSTVLWFTATAAALSSLLLVDQPNVIELKRVLLYPLAAYLTAVGLGSLTNRQTDILDTARLKAASAIGANLAHELRTPLASIRALSGGVDRFLPTLVEAYKQAAEAGLDVEPLRPKQVETLKKALHTIQSEVQYSNTIIDMLLVNTADKLSDDPENECFSVKDCVEEAVNRYPFNNEAERRLISLRLENDFLLTAPRLLVVHILFNLIKNGLQFVQRKEGASIEISAEQDDECSRISVHDTGPGISYFSLPHVFDRFYSTNRTGQGAGIGLSFCKMVMDQIGGDISCDSVEGEYTTFTLTFPNQRND
jgi:two-component system CAI-1 autoinducer sensor kinase/phosphatase CqsS